MIYTYLIFILSTIGSQNDKMDNCRNAFRERDSISVIKYCTPLAELGNDTAQAYLGITYLSKSDFDNAKIWFEKSAALGNSDGQDGIGYLYQMGFGVPKNIEIANSYFLKSAEQGNSDAQFWLGENLFLEGKQEQGFEFTKKASFGGSCDAQYNLAVMYLNGQGTEKDLSQSLIWFIISATNGNEKAKEYVDNVRQKISEESFQEILQITKDFVNKNPAMLN